MKKHLFMLLLMLLPMAASADDSDPINFVDANAKAICVANWDTNGDGELSYAEAAAVTSIDHVFSSSNITFFNEFMYFTGVTSIGNYTFSGCSGLTSVTIPNSVTSIGSGAFSGCSGLTSVTIPNSVTSIGEWAFAGCSGLTSVTIPNSVTSIGDFAFYGCSGLTSITIPNSVTSISFSAFSGCSGLTSISVESGNTVYDSRDNCNAVIETISNTLLVGCENTVIVNSVTSIGNQAFSGCSGLTSVIIPSGVTSIGNLAFQECSGLTSISVESGNTVYDSRENCNAIIKTSTNELVAGCKNTNIPNSVTSIGDEAFCGCSGLTSITIPNSVTSIGHGAFLGCGGLNSVTIGSSVTSIGSSAFYSCSGLTSVTIPNSVTSIGNLAFAYCSGLTSISVESGNAVYDSRENCNAIIKTSTNELVVGCKNTVIPNSVTSIGNYAFEGCSGLTSITIPNSVTSIGYNAFQECSSLTSVTIGNSVTSIGNCAFESCSGLTSVTIPNSVTSIGNDAFWGCSGLTSVTIGNSVTSIGGGAFFYCIGLTSVTIPNSVTSINECAFWYCSGLSSVTCLAENVPTTNSRAFDNVNIGNATLVVPAGSVAAYQAAAPWSGFGQITDQTDISQIDNVIYIEPFEARPGRAEREVSIKMKNTAAIRGFQFDLVLPEGVTPVTSGASIFRKLNNSRFPKDDFDERYHTLNISLQSDGSYRFLCGSTQDQTLIGNDGEIILLKVNIDENLAERDYPIILRNMKLTESDISNYYETDVLLTKITVQNYETGDISGDGVVDVSDYIGVANHILGNTPVGFDTYAADVNNDGVIDVSDYIGIANIILTGSIYGNSNNAAPAFEEDAELDPQ